MTTPGSMLSGRSMMYLHPLQGVGHRRRHHRDRGVAALAVWPTMPLLGVALALTADRLRRRHGLSGRNRLDPECRADASGRHRDRRHEFLPRARQHARGRDHGRDPARRARRDAGARHRRRKLLVRNRRRRRHRHGGGVPLGVRRRRRCSWLVAFAAVLAHGGASAAGPCHQAAPAAPEAPPAPAE